MTENVLVKKLFVLDYIIFALTVFSVLAGTEYASILFVCGFVCLFLIMANYFSAKVDVTTGILYLIIFLSFISVWVSSINNGVAINYAGLVNFFAFVSTLIFVDISRKTIIDRNYINIILEVSIITAALYPIGYVVFGFSTQVNLFTMNFSNPNLTGMFLVQSVFYCTIGILLFDKLLSKGICVLLMCADYWLMWNTDARNCVIAHFLFLLVLIWCIMKRQKHMKQWMLIGFTVFPLIFMWLYLYIIDIVIGRGWLSFLVKEGKSLDARVAIWLDVLEKLKGHYLFGNYFVIGGNAHNSHLSIWSSFGGIVLVLTIVFLYRCMKEINSNSFNPKNTICLAAFCGSLFMGIAEGALFCGSLGLYIPACGFLLFANADWSRDTERGWDDD